MSRRGLLLVVGCVLALFGGAFAFSERPPAMDAVAELQVRNLTCGACVAKIDEVLSAVDGVGKAEVDLATGRVRVAFNAERADAATIAATLANAGYPAALVGKETSATAIPTAKGMRCPASKPVAKSGCGGGCCG